MSGGSFLKSFIDSLASKNKKTVPIKKKCLDDCAQMLACDFLPVADLSDCLVLKHPGCGCRTSPQCSVVEGEVGEMGPTGPTGEKGDKGLGFNDPLFFFADPSIPAMWLRSDFGTSTTTNGDFVSSWNDMTINNRNATQINAANRPQFISSGLNGYPAIRFTKTAHPNQKFLEFDGSFLALSDYTFLVVEGRRSNAINNYFVSDNSTFVLGYNTDTSFSQFHTGATFLNTPAIAGYSGAGSDFRVTVVRFVKNIGMSIRRMGIEVAVSLTAVTAAATFSGAVIGWQSSSLSNIYDGDLVEFIVFDRCLTTLETAQWENYVKNRYNL